VVPADGHGLRERRPGIKVLMTRKSSGEFYAQLKAEAANPRGDIWWGGTATRICRRPRKG
jgi:ABC-type Fe3+ transport system substrate-binding protein